MIIDRHNGNNHVQHVAELQVVDKCIYPGTLINNTGGCNEEIKKHIAIAKNAKLRLNKIWKSLDISSRTLVRLLVMSIFIYVSKCWTL